MNADKVALLAAATSVSARYAAFNFYQAQKDTPLTPEEMEEIATGIMKEISSLTVEIAKTLVSEEKRG